MELLFCFVTSCKLKKKKNSSGKSQEWKDWLLSFQGAPWGSGSVKQLSFLATDWAFWGFSTPFLLARGVPSLCFVLSKCCTDGSSLGPAQPARHNVLPEGSVFLDPPGCHHIFSCTFWILVFERLLACLCFCNGSVDVEVVIQCSCPQPGFKALPKQLLSFGSIVCVQWAYTLKLPSA